MGGNVSTFECFGHRVTTRRADPDDLYKVEAFIDTVGFEQAAEIVSAHPGLQQVLEECDSEFPEHAA